MAQKKHNHGGGGHCHAHQVQEKTIFSKAFRIAIIANFSFVIVQVIFGLIANSTSLLADAMHNLGDVLSLVLAWFANSLLNRTPTQTTTYGMKKISILVALVNGFLLVFTCGMIVTEALYKLFTPEPVQALTVMIVATIGILVNGSTAMLFLKGSGDLNVKAAYLHLAYDALISFGVVLGALVIYWTGWLSVDPLIGLVIAFIILKGTWGLFKDSFRLLIDGVPSDISVRAVMEELAAIPGVKQVHDLHIWALSTRENALSVHLWMPDMPLRDEIRQKIEQMLKEKHNIHHTTIQVELALDYCADSCRQHLV